VLSRVYQRLYDALTGPQPVANAQAILEILRDTKTDLPAYWSVPEQR
jgi:hypothetical protein